jgi:crotonobetainyl-CoA:carnitine CoA-transferase CaiB-like acyl-CoA transferase
MHRYCEEERARFSIACWEIANLLLNLRKSTITKLGVDYENISKVNPKIICAGISGYSPEGPMSDLERLILLVLPTQG